MADDSTAWYGVRVSADGHATYYTASVDKPAMSSQNGKSISDFNSSDVIQTPLN